MAEAKSPKQEGTKTEKSGTHSRKARPIEVRFRERANTAVGRLKSAVNAVEAVGTLDGDVPDDLWEAYVEYLQEAMDALENAPRPEAGRTVKKSHDFL